VRGPFVYSHHLLHLTLTCHLSPFPPTAAANYVSESLQGTSATASKEANKVRTAVWQPPALSKGQG